VLHLGNGLDQPGVADAQAGLQWQALVVVALADAFMHEQLTDRGGGFGPVVARDFGQHHVAGRHPAGAGEAVAVDLEELGLDVEVWKSLAEAFQVFPVYGAAIAVQQPGMGQHMSAGANRAHMRALARPAPEPAEHHIVMIELRVEPATDYHVFRMRPDAARRRSRGRQ
jgi:hypothetical protein